MNIPARSPFLATSPRSGWSTMVATAASMAACWLRWSEHGHRRRGTPSARRLASHGDHRPRPVGGEPPRRLPLPDMPPVGGEPPRRLPPPGEPHRPEGWPPTRVPLEGHVSDHRRCGLRDTCFRRNDKQPSSGVGLAHGVHPASHRLCASSMVACSASRFLPIVSCRVVCAACHGVWDVGSFFLDVVETG